MGRERYFEATEFENIKQLIYNSAEKFADNIAFVIKHKEEKLYLKCNKISKSVEKEIKMV